METAPLYRQVRLHIQNPRDVELALCILKSEATVSKVADMKDQDEASFEGNGDVLVLSYVTDYPSLPSPSAIILADKESKSGFGDQVFRDLLIPALAISSARIELVVWYCNLSLVSVFALADAIRQNRYLVGFTVMGNPGNNKQGNMALTQACIGSRAPISWFQGAPLSDSLVDQQGKCQSEQCEQHSASSKEFPCCGKMVLQDNDHDHDDDCLRHHHHHQLQRNRRQSSAAVSNNGRQEWLERAQEQARLLAKDEADVDRIVENLELEQLDKTLEPLLISASSLRTLCCGCLHRQKF